MQLHSLCKKLFVVGLICLYASHAKSQVIIALLFGNKLNTDKVEFGLTGGLNQSYLTNFNDSKSKTGLNLGLYLNFKLGENWFAIVQAVPKFPTGVSKLRPYSLNDSNLDSLFRNGEVTRKIKNIALPILVRYRIKNQFFAEAGPQVGLRTKAKDVFESGNLTYKNKIEDNITRFDFGFAFGLVQKLNKNIGSMAVGVRYYMGITDIDKITEGAQKNGVFQILANIPVGAGKQKQKEKN